MDRFSFTPDKGFEDASSFPDPGVNRLPENS